jgi:prepilin-type N-terminal cleavage/methylation domain-containing protein
MRTPRWRAAQGGMTLPELLIAMVVMAIVGAVLARLLISQNRFFGQQLAGRSARMVSRGAVNLLLSDLRMVDASGAPGDTLGVVAAAPRSLTLRVPYGLGVACNVGVANVTVTLVPLDTLMLNTAAFTGFGWRDTVAGKYHYVEAGAAVANSTPASCAAGFSTLTGARVVAVSPVPVPGGVGGGVAAGVPVFLYQRITYDLKSSVTFPGRFGLWRTLVTSGLTEEIAAPFDTSAVFRFYRLNADTSQAAVPAQLSDLRGVEIVLKALSQYAAQGRSAPEQIGSTTAVFFKNRLN